jgi:hypothetical protein
MRRRAIASRSIIIVVLVLQFIPLLLFPPKSFSPETQEWWLPVLLTLLVVWADVELIVRRNDRMWPWYLISFSQGFNIISRIMMIWPHATITVNNVETVYTSFIVLSLIAMVLSAFLLWYTELPDVRMGLARE